MRLLERLRKIKNKGFSLTELVCAMAILAILGTAISGVMLVSINSFRNGNNEANVQEEIQLVCNQISDFLIDSTAEVEFASSTLTIHQGTKTYKIYRKADSKIYFQEDGGEEQLMAENVETFDVDVSDFADNGNVKVSMKVEKSGRSNVSNYTVTARNKEVKVNNTNTASITVPTEVVLIPGESFDLSPSVSGLVNETINWELFNATDSTINHGIVSIGNSENTPLIKAHGVTVETVNGKPAAECWVNVYVRRVNNISVDGSLKSGNAAKAGSVYWIDVTDISGLRTGDTESGTPVDQTCYNVRFGVTANFADPSSAYEINYIPNLRRAVVTLKRTLSSAQRLTITAYACHAVDGANRINNAYDTNVKASYDIVGLRIPLWDVPEGDGWRRQSDEHQARLIEDALRAYIEESGAADNSWKYFMRYKPMKDADTELAPFSAWIPAGAGNGGDANGSMHLNLRPGLTSIFQYNVLYKIEIIVRLYDNAGNEKWPLNDPDDIEIATYSSLMMPVTVKFDSTVPGYEFEEKDGNTYADRFKVKRNSNVDLIKLSRVKDPHATNYGEAVVTGIPGDRIMNALNYKVEKLNGSTWEEYNMNLQQGDTVRMNNLQNHPVGIYRIKVWAKDMTFRRIDSNGVTIGQEERANWDLFDQNVTNTSNDSGYGIFYFELYD